MIGLRSAGRQAGRDVAISAITHLLPASATKSTKCPVHVESTQEGGSQAGSISSSASASSPCLSAAELWCPGKEIPPW